MWFYKGEKVLINIPEGLPNTSHRRHFNGRVMTVSSHSTGYRIPIRNTGSHFQSEWLVKLSDLNSEDVLKLLINKQIDTRTYNKLMKEREATHV